MKRVFVSFDLFSFKLKLNTNQLLQPLVTCQAESRAAIHGQKFERFEIETHKCQSIVGIYFNLPLSST